MSAPRQPVVLEALQTPAEASQKSTVIFLHGLGDDGRGTGYGLAQQFQIHQKRPYTRWVLPTAEVDPAVGQRCWYKPHELPSPEDDAAGWEEEEDEEGIMRTVQYVDSLVAEEVGRGTPPERIVVGGFSQGCAVSMVWGLKGEWRDKVAGVFGLGGYLPKIKAVTPEGLGGDAASGQQHVGRWFFGHGMSDSLVSISLFAEGQKRLQQYVDRDSIEGHVYQELGHDVGGGEIRDLWMWLNMVAPE